MRSRRCETCRFEEAGYCHRESPIMMPTSEGFHTSFPRIINQMWCGEWRLSWRRILSLFNRKDQP